MYSLLFLFWVFLENSNIINDNKKLKENVIKIIHSVLCSLFILLTLNNFLSIQYFYNFSKTYFIWDTGQILIHRGFDFPYIYHHLSALYILNIMISFNGINDIFFLKSFLVAELSNLSIYTTYHLIKKKYNNPLIKLCQILWYGFFRIYLYTLYTYDNYHKFYHNKFLFFNLISIYCMGIMWWLIQNKNFYNELKIRYYKKNESNIMDLIS